MCNRDGWAAGGGSEAFGSVELGGRALLVALVDEVALLVDDVVVGLT